jgi:mannose-1-phosphate guanylyltransferase/mannose-6-phosphate isomerase
LSLVGDETLLQQTLDRVKGIEDIAPPLVIGCEAYRFLIAEHLRQAGLGGQIILEPEGRNTAPAAAVAALQALEEWGEDAQLLILPSDHAIAEPQRFAEAVAIGRNLARENRLVTFGVTPQGPETGYGYIRAGEELGPDTYKIDAFVEKPDQTAAAAYIEAGGYYWNSGIFLFSARTYLNNLERMAPDILQSSEAAYARSERDADFLRLDEEAFAACRADSIDYAVMEQTAEAAVVPLNTAWSDLGSWTAVAETDGCDTNGNTLRGDVRLDDSRGCFVHSDSRLVTLLGVRDTIVVETKDAVLVADRTREQAIKAMVTRLQTEGRNEANEHRVVYRPWGSYETIAEGHRFQAKRIIVKPGGRLSLQKHHHRAEHWVIVQGTARATRDDEQMLLTENESTYIPLGSVHRLENPGQLDLVVIEIQSGAYLGEDDIVRFDDIYGRAAPAQTLASDKPVADTAEMPETQ